MSTTTKQLGFLIKNRGEYKSSPETRYYKDNVVQYMNSSFICDPVNYDESTNPLAYTTIAPLDEDGKLNEGWRIFAVGSDTLAQQAIEEAKENAITEINNAVQQYAPVQITGNVNNASDEEDLTSVNVQGTDVLKLKDKVYNSLVFSGLGKTYLRKNIQEVTEGSETVTRNILTQEMISEPNTIYIIQYDYTLENNITIPNNCVLKFDGGSLTGSSLVGNNTFVDINQSTPVFNNIKMLGSFHAKEFPLNLYNTTKIDYLYTLLQSFSGTKFVLTADYSVTETDNTIDGTTPNTLNLDGNGYKLTLHSFGAYNMTRCSIKNITIEAQNNSVGSWHTDIFKFGLLGYTATSTLDIHNVTFTSDVYALYMRSFKSINISNCLEEGTYFHVATTHCVTIKDCRVINATGGYYQINDNFTPDDEDFTIINNCYFENLSSFGIILTGGIKMNTSVTNCKLINVGSGSAVKACINTHPKGAITIKNNYIVANVGASTLDIDAARADLFSDNTVVFVENNIFRNVTGDTTIHSMALVGLRRLYLRNNDITDQKFFFWDTVDMECIDNVFSYTNAFTESTYIASTNTHDFTVNYPYNHYYKNNIFNIKGHLTYIHWEYKTTSTKGNIYGIGNIWNDIDFVINSTNLNIYGDIYVYDQSDRSKHISTDNVYLSGVKNNELYTFGLKRYNPYSNFEIRGSILGQVDNHLNPVGTIYVGNTATRPTLCLPGTAYFDTTLNKMIYAQGTKAKLAVQITSGLTSPDGSLVSDSCVAFMKNMTIVCNRKTITQITLDNIFEYYAVNDNNYRHFINRGLLNIQTNWNTHTKTIQCIYVGEIGDDYGVVHSNTVNGFTTSYNLVNDGTISWVDATGTQV